MRQLKFVFLASLLFFIITNSRSQENSPASSSIDGVFVASTPCSQGTRPVPGMAADIDCELIKWNLTLYKDESKNIPTTYKLHCVYGMSKPGTTGFIGGGKKIELEGKWAIIKGTANPHAIIYQLNDDKTNTTISFIKISDNVLHLLDSDRRLMIGSAAWSYTLNRMNTIVR